MNWNNPIPGDPSYHPRRHGNPSNQNLLALFEALATGDQAAAANHGGALLLKVAQDGANQDVVDNLRTAFQGTMARVAQGGMPPGSDGLDSPGSQDDNIDWYPPDPNFFYVLDKKSGAVLGTVLEDLRVADRYVARGARAPTRLLFVGAPGNGKTMGARWLGSKLGVKVALVRIDATVVATVGGIAKKLRLAFEAAQAEGAITVIDEFEAVAVPRTNQSGNVGQWSRETTSALLQLLDSLPPQQIVIGATNYMSLVDEAVQRRMRKHVFFHPPDRDTRAMMVGRWWAKAPHDSKAKKLLLDLSEGYSGDVLERISEEANMAAARRSLTEHVSVEDVRLSVESVLGVIVATATEQAGALVPTSP